MSTDSVAPAVDPNAGLTKTQLKNKLRREKEKKAKAEGANQESKSSEAAQLAAGFKDLAIHSFFEGHMKLSHHKTKGRHVVATKNLQPGETVFTSAPYAAVVTDAMVDQICHRCFQPPSGAKPMLYLCSGCKHARFCSTNCMNAFKHIHGLECKTLERLEEHLGMEGETAALRLVIRMMYLQRQEKMLEEFKQAYDKIPVSQIPKEKRFAYSAAKLFAPKAGLSFEDCANLESHEQDFSSEAKVDIAMIMAKVEDIVDKDALLPIPVATKLFLQISVNAHHIVDRQKRRLGLALYPSASYMNHSCRPNCIYFFNPNGQIEVRTVEEVKEGQELTYSYIDMYMRKKERAERLKSVYYIERCYCGRCQENQATSLDRYLGGFTCGKCGELLVEKEEKQDEKSGVKLVCSSASCDGVRDKESCEAMEREANALRDRGLTQLSRGDVDEARRYLEEKLMKGEAGKVLHKHHVTLFNAALALVAVTREQLDWAAQAEYCKKVVDSLEMLKLSNHPECADAFYALGEALIGCAADADGSSEAAKDAKETLLLEARAAFEKSLAIRNICYGPKHSITKEAQVRVNDLTPKGEKKKGKK